MPTEWELELEDLAVLTKLIVQNIREGCEDPYGQVYALRTRLGREVAKPSFDKSYSEIFLLSGHIL